MRNVLKKIKRKDGGTGIIVVIAAVLIVFLGTLPTIIDSSFSHIGIKKLKGHAYAAANSATLVIPKIEETGEVTYQLDKGAEVVRNFYSTLFGQSLDLVEQTTVDPNNRTVNYYKCVYVTPDGKKAVEYIAYIPKGRFKAPSNSELNYYVSHTTANGAKTLGQVAETTEVSKPTVIVISKYDFETKFHIGANRETLQVIASSQINFRRLNVN